MTETDADRIARRYPRPRRRAWIPLAVVLGVAGLAWLVWAGLHGATGVVTGRVDAFTVRSDTLIDVTVTIDRPDTSRAGSCRVFAQAVSHERVGELEVVVPAGGAGVTQLVVPVRTYLRATTADVESCR